MPRCPSCAHSLTRARRRPLERLLFGETFLCSKCGHRSAHLYPGLAVRLTFVFSRFTRCVQCGSTRVQRTASRHLVDAPSRNLFSRLLGLTGAPLNKCSSCRVHYRDWRTPRPIPRVQADATHAATQ